MSASSAAYDPGTSASAIQIATDMAAGMAFQRIKLADPTPGSSAHWGTADNPINVSVSFPAVQSVSGTVSINNFPATQTIAGTVAATQSGAWTTGRTWALTGASDAVAVTALPAITGSVSVLNLPATQPISATALPLPSGAATDASTAAITTSLGTDGASPPSIPGTGVRGWLRSIYDSLQSLLNALNPYRGTSTPQAGTSGTVSVASGSRVVSIAAHATTAATVTIGSATVPIPAGTQFSDGYSGLVGPLTITFSGTDSFYVVTNG